MFLSALLGVGGGEGIEELHPWPFGDVPQRVATAWPRHRDVRATAAGGRHVAHRQRGNGGWGTREMMTAIIARGGTGATKKKVSLSAAVNDHSLTMTDFSVLRPGEQALF